MTIDIRPTRPDEWRSASDAMAIALMTRPADDERWQRIEPSWRDGHSISAWDGDRCVGNASHVPVDTVLPGGARVPTAAVARVGVMPTHRRRGVGSGLMRAVIHDAVERGRVLSSLRASEGAIYGRYGYGIAGSHVSAAIDARRARPPLGEPAPGTFRVLAGDEVLATVGPLYERVALRRPGAITRPSSWTERLLRSAIEGSTASFVAVHTDAAGVDDGYVHYTLGWSDDDDAWVRGTGEVVDLFGADDAVEVALWHYVLGVDLVDRWTAEARPLDDLAHHLVADPRAYQVTLLEDEQWLRILDVDAVLSARSYGAVAESIVVAVDDPLLPHNTGAWQIDAGGARRTDAAPDLRCDIAALSALSLGGPSWATLAGAGRVVVEHDSAITAADALFASRRAPFCGTFF